MFVQRGVAYLLRRVWKFEGNKYNSKAFWKNKVLLSFWPKFGGRENITPEGPGSDGPVYLRRQNVAGETSETMLLLPTYSQTYVEYGNTDCGVFKQGYKIRKIFAKETTYPKEIIEFWDLY